MKNNDNNASFELSTNEKRRAQVIKLKVSSIAPKDRAYLLKIISWCLLSENLKLKLRKAIQFQMKKLDRVLALFLFIGFITNLIQDLMYFEFDKIRTDTAITVKIKGVPSLTIQIFRFFTSITTLICLIILPFHYKIERYLLIMKNETSMNRLMVSWRDLPKIIVIVFVIVIHSPPYFDGFFVTIKTTDIVPKYVKVDLLMFTNVLVSLRWLLAINYFSLYSIFADDRADKICEESKVTRDFFFTLKSQLKYQPVLCLILLFVASVFLLGYILRNTELPFIQDVPLESFQDWTNILNGLWCVMLSFFTIAYGDYYPMTIFGRIVMGVSCIWGIFLIGLFIINVSTAFQLNNVERRVFDEVRQEDKLSYRKHIALKCIYAFYSFDKAKAGNAPAKKRKEFNQLRFLLSAHRNLRRNEYQVQTQSETTQLLDKFNTKVEVEINALINKTRAEIEATRSKLKASRNIQEKIKRYAKTVSKITKSLYDCIEIAQGEEHSLTMNDTKTE